MKIKFNFKFERICSFLVIISMVFHSVLVFSAPKIKIDRSYNKYKNRKNIKDKIKFIVLHTTETSKNAINSIRRYGSANYLIQNDGQIIAVVPRNRKSYHAGRSLWQGHEWVGNYSIGIEVEGFHNKPIYKNQIESLKALLSYLKKIYSIKDENIVTHSMVAYGNPNRWHKYKHRGRKRCGMLFSDPELRIQLGIQTKANEDRDVLEKKLEVADKELYSFLFKGTGLEFIYDEELVKKPSVITSGVTPWDIARGDYDASSTIYTFPNGEKLLGSEISDWSKIPIETKVSFLNCDDKKCLDQSTAEYVPEQMQPQFFIKGRDGHTAYKLAGREYAKSSTHYFIPYGDRYRLLNGEELIESKEYNINQLPDKTKVLLGYTYHGKVTLNHSALSRAKEKWNDSRTVYYNVHTADFMIGSRIDPSNIQIGTIVLTKID